MHRLSLDASPSKPRRTRQQEAKFAPVDAERLTVHHDGAVVRAIGEVDASTCSKLDEMLFTLDGSQPAFVDLSAVTFMDSSGLRVLIAHHHARADETCRLKIVNPSLTVRRLLEITGLEALCVE
jgi:anti-sigma B factor antagonist